MKRIAPPARARPREKSRMPVRSVARAKTIVGRPHFDQPLGHFRSKRCGNRGGRAVRSGYGEGKRAPCRHKRCGDGRGHKGGRDTVSEPGVKRCGEDQSREGEAIRDRHDAGGNPGKQIVRLCDEVAGPRALSAPGNTFERHSSQILQAPAPFLQERRPKRSPDMLSALLSESAATNSRDV